MSAILTFTLSLLSFGAVQAPAPSAAPSSAPAPEHKALFDDYAKALAEKRSAKVLELGERLRALGPAAAPALESAFAALNYGPKIEVRKQARALLDGIGVAALQPLLRRALESGRTEIESFRPADADALARLFDELARSGELERKWIALVIDNQGEPAVEELLRRVRESSGDEQLRAVQAARAMAWRAGPLVDELAKLLESSSPELRYWATFALAGAQPASTFVLVQALTHADPRVRVAAAEGLARAIDPVRSSPRHPDVQPYETWHGATRNMNAEAKRFRALADGAVPQLAAALGDSEPLVRMFAALTLEKLGGKAKAAREALLRAKSDADGAVRVWAALALQRVDAAYYDLAEALALAAPEDAPPPTAEQLAQWWIDIEHAPEWEPPEDDLGGGGSWDGSEDKRWSAALGLARCCGRDLLAQLESESAESVEAAKARLESIERESWKHVNKLLRTIQESLGTHERAQAELRGIGAALVGELRQDYLRYPRFPIGDGSYEALTDLLADWGAPGVAALVHGLDHWSYFGRPTACDELMGAGAVAADFAPAIVSVWRCAGDNPRAPGVESWWEGRDQGGDALGDMWEISESGSGSSKWGDVNGLRERDNVALLARALGPAAMGAFLRALDDEHATVRARAASSLMALGEPAREHLPALVARLRDDEPRVRLAAARAVIALAPTSSADAAAARALLEQR